MARRLAAIVAVDVVGFSRLMATDEDETWAAWSELRGLIDPIFETGGGRVVKSTGDGVLVESPSVIEAVKSAVRVQEVTSEWNHSRPADRALRLRIGVNLGDVIVADDGDVYGDGVNVAARLEGLADPGGVCISDSAYRQVRGRVDARFVDRGEQWVKNIPTPVKVWALLGSDSAGTEVEVGVSGLEHAEVVGRGGNATVYRAYQRAMDRWVAVKVLDGSDEATRRRFDRERQAMGRLSQHPGIVTIYESGYTLEGRPYLVMPFLGSGSLRDRLDRSGPMPWTEAADIIAQVARAVDHAHRAEIVHRDLKPGNIMLDDEGRPLVADFGIARLANQTVTVTERLALTPAYSPPEMLDGAEPTAAGDIYGLAATFCALVSGSPPFVTGSPDSDTLLALSRRIAADPPPDLSPFGVPDHVNLAVAGAMAKVPGLRPESARAFADALLGASPPAVRTIEPSGGRSGEVSSPPSAAPVLRRWLPGGAAVVIVAAIVAGLSTFGGNEGNGSTTTTAETVGPTEAPSTTSASIEFGFAEWAVSFESPIVSVVLDPTADCDTGLSCAARAIVMLENGTLEAIDVRSGSSVWGEPFDTGVGSVVDIARFARDVVVTGDRVFFVRPGSKLIYAIDGGDGTQEWRTLAPFDAAQDDPRIAEADGSLYVGFGLGAARLDSSGKAIWSEASASFLLIDHLSASGRLLAVSDGRGVYGIDTDTGSRQWDVGPPDLDSPVWVLAQEIEVQSGTGRSFDRRVFVETGDRDLLLLDGDDGALLWSIAISQRPGTPPNDAAFVGGVDGELVAVESVTGDPLWVNSDVRVDGPPVASGGVVYVLDGLDVVAFNVRSGNERGRVTLPAEPTVDIRAIGDLVLVAIDDALLALRMDA